MNDRIERVKAHFIEHKTAYLCTAGGVVIGTIVGLVISKKGGINIQVVDSLKVQICSPTENYITMIARGDPGNVVRCDQTGITYPSQEIAAISNKIDPGNLSRHLNGKQPHVNDLTFTKLGKATVEV